MLIGHSLADNSGHLMAVDPQVCEIMHRDERELVGMSYEALTHPDDRPHNVRLIAGLAIDTGPVTIRKRYLRPDGSVVWSNVRASRLETGGVVRLIGTIELVNPLDIARGPASLWRSALHIHGSMQRRRTELGDDLFADFPWLILLEIYLAEAEGRKVDAVNIAERASILRPLADRWIRVLEQRRLVECSEWTEFAPQLTAMGVALIEKLLDSSVQD